LIGYAEAHESEISVENSNRSIICWSHLDANETDKLQFQVRPMDHSSFFFMSGFCDLHSRILSQVSGQIKCMWLLNHVSDCPNDYDGPGTDVVYVERIWMTFVDSFEVIQGVVI
jgi:hypothetical protein